MIMLDSRLECGIVGVRITGTYPQYHNRRFSCSATFPVIQRGRRVSVREDRAMKKCSKCRQWKQEHEFGSRKTARNALRSQCRQCERNYSKIYRTRHPAKIQAANKTYYHLHREDARVRHQWYKKTERGKQAYREAHLRYYATAQGKAVRRAISKRFHRSEKGRQARLRYKAKYPERVCCRLSFNAAVASGRISRPTKCSSCGLSESIIHGHHPDYLKPFDVVWLCSNCHAKETKRLGELE